MMVAEGIAVPFQNGAEKRKSLAKEITAVKLRMDSEPTDQSVRKVGAIVEMGIDYFSWLTGRSYPMPGILVVETDLVGRHEGDPPRLVLGRGANHLIVLHELVHHLRSCNGIGNDAYSKNPYTEEMATQFIAATVFSGSADYESVVADVYSRTPRSFVKIKLDLMAFQEVAYALRTIAEDGMDPGSEKTQRTFFRRAIYDLSRDRRLPRHISGFGRFDYLRYPVGTGMAMAMYSKLGNIEEASRRMLLLDQEELTESILRSTGSESWERNFFAVVSYLRGRLGPVALRVAGLE